MNPACGECGHDIDVHGPVVHVEWSEAGGLTSGYVCSGGCLWAVGSRTPLMVVTRS